jgi:UDP-N-acetylmuramate dehydrogenase
VTSSAASLAVRESVPLAPFTTLGVGGPATWFATASTVHHVTAAHAWAREHQLPLLAIGGGSNLVIADGGFRGLVLRLGLEGTVVESSGDDVRITAGAGELWDDFVASIIDRGLAGIECLSGIPGTVGGTPIQNVGAYGQEVAESIESVAVYDTVAGHVQELPASACGFSYRMSRFKAEPGRFIVTHVTFRLRRGEPRVRYPDLRAWLEWTGIREPTLADVRRAVIAVRRTKGLVNDPADPDSRSVGSFFMNPIVPAAVHASITAIAGEASPAFPVDSDRVKIPAAWLIERAGFHKGYADGPAGISTKHPLALVNRGGATADDVLRLAVRIKREVAERFGVFLRPEPMFVGFEGDAAAAYLLRHGTE